MSKFTIFIILALLLGNKTDVSEGLSQRLSAIGSRLLNAREDAE
jgi:hypothetical protein